MSDLPVSVAADSEDLFVREWPLLLPKAYPGFLGEFVALATGDSEADPAAVCVTAIVRFGTEVYGFSPNQGPHIYVGETLHPPHFNAVIVGSNGKARKGTSKHPVTKLFQCNYCLPADLEQWNLPLPALESGGPLSTGEGLAVHVRDESREERERKKRQNPNEPAREEGDKRLIVLDEEFASGLACTRRDGNTLSMAIRSFWDSGDYLPLTKNNPTVVRGAHVCILTHITMQELALPLATFKPLTALPIAFCGYAPGTRNLFPCRHECRKRSLPRSSVNYGVWSGLPNSAAK